MGARGSRGGHRRSRGRNGVCGRRAPAALARPGLLSASLLLALGSAACAALDAGPDVDGSLDAGPSGAPPDASPEPIADAGARDAAPPANRDEGEFEDGVLADPAAAAEGCFDGADNDGDGRFDCQDPSCQANVPSCCVGASSTTCCVESAPVTLPFEGCGSDLSTCQAVTDLFDVFGSSSPRVRTWDGDASETFLPGGQSDDSGVLFPERLDPRTGTIRLAAEVASSTTPPEGVVDALAVGVVDAGVDPATLTRVTPLAAFVVSRNRQEVGLVVAGETVERWTLPDDAFHRYELTLAPDGTVRFFSDWAEPIDASAVLSLSDEVRMVAYGRSANPGSGDPAPVRARLLERRTEACDMPAALSRREAPVVPAASDGPWAEAHASIERPHVIAYEDPPGTPRVRMALMVDGEIHLATPVDDGFALERSPGTPVLEAPAEPWAAAGVEDPVLRWTGERLELWYTGRATDGAGTVARAVWDEASGEFVHEAVVLRPGDHPEVTGFSHAAPFELDGRLLAAVREDLVGGHRIALWAIDEAGASFVRELAAPSGELFAFDRHEVAAPAVLVEDGVVRVYYAARRGTRWSLGLTVSSDGRWWRAPSDGPVLGGDGAGFDAIGVRDPAPVVVDGALHLHFAGSDGARTRIGLATRPAPPR